MLTYSSGLHDRTVNIVIFMHAAPQKIPDKSSSLQRSNATARRRPSSILAAEGATSVGAGSPANQVSIWRTGPSGLCVACSY